ncbi:hypothetical protein [Methanolapillus ohkumae]|uniref:Uncharacterized protein n=1 Tax=Methanolapillus ohkumae TaxID=3028298 RepID=A0AA96V4Z1_9EURY|nr:hypothetical protein MsAm2_00680 [Methanosarcinaceae archaeon Am2]
MNNANKTTILIIISFLFFLTLVVFPFFAAGQTDSDSLSNEIRVIKTENDFFEKIKQNGEDIAVGTVPDLEGEDAYEWYLQLDSVSEKVYNEGLLNPYLRSNNGPVTGHGATMAGYIGVSICPNCEISKSDADEIIRIYQEAGEEAGIENIPIVIAKGYPQNAISEPGEKSNAIPGYEMIYSTIVFFVTIGFLIRIRNKK